MQNEELNQSLNNTTYEVGQVLYCVLNTKLCVVPLQVVEVINKKTLSGVKVSYVVRHNGKADSTVGLSAVNGDIYTSVDEIKKSLIEKASKQINTIVNNAVNKASEWYGKTAQVAAEVVTEPNFDPNLETQVNESLNKNQEIITLPDNTKVKVNYKF